MYLFDLHVHTVRGSGDSSLSPQELVQEARRLGLHGVCVTEHSAGWPRQDFQRFAQEQDLVLLQGLEVETDMGHVIVFGLDGYVPGMARVEELRRIVDQAGGFMVSAHPFRGLFNPPPYNRLLINNGLDRASPTSVEEALDHPLFGLVDDIEVANGANTEEENGFALEVAQRLAMRGTGGSDAHSTHGIGRCLTAFRDGVGTEEDLLRALRAGAYYSVRRLPDGTVQPTSALKA